MLSVNIQIQLKMLDRSKFGGIEYLCLISTQKIVYKIVIIQCLIMNIQLLWYFN